MAVKKATNVHVPQRNQPMVLITDASEQGGGASILQVQTDPEINASIWCVWDIGPGNGAELESAMQCSKRSSLPEPWSVRRKSSCYKVRPPFIGCVMQLQLWILFAEVLPWAGEECDGGTSNTISRC